MKCDTYPSRNISQSLYCCFLCAVCSRYFREPFFSRKIYSCVWVDFIRSFFLRFPCDPNINANDHLTRFFSRAHTKLHQSNGQSDFSLAIRLLFDMDFFFFFVSVARPKNWFFWEYARFMSPYISAETKKSVKLQSKKKT